SSSGSRPECGAPAWPPSPPTPVTPQRGRGAPRPRDDSEAAMLIDAGHRRWIVASLLILAVATAFYVPYVRAALNGPSGGSLHGLVYGIVGFAFMIFAGLLGARRRVPTWRIGRGTLWLRGHRSEEHTSE